MTNPLLADYRLPPFQAIRPEHVEAALNQLLADNRRAVSELTATNQPPSWDGLVTKLDDLDNRLSKMWSPVGHLNAVMNGDALRAAYNACLPKLAAYSTELGQNEDLYRAYRKLADSLAFSGYDAAQKSIVKHALRDFHLSGVDLPADKKMRYAEIQQELSQLSSQFSDHVLDATNAWSTTVTDAAVLSGVPESALAVARAAAEQAQEEGWRLTLDFPCYHAVMTYADDRALRAALYHAYTTRASEVGPHAGQFDNGPLMERILALKHEEAGLLGYANYAELSLATKMAGSTDEVLRFLYDLAERAKPYAQRDLAELRGYAAEQHGAEQLEPWDLMYYSEKLRQHRFEFTQEEVKAYFPVERVIPGMFAVVERLFGLRIEETTGVEVWHPDVKFYAIRDASNALRGEFYLDLYARAKKRGGAWMDEFVARRRYGDAVQTPVAYLTCNFTPSVEGKPSLLTHDEVETLFHEFGHGLHHMLTQVDYLGVSGIHGVEWDAVELPSQFMENWCWDHQALDLISGHYATGEKLPQTLLDRMTAAKNFQSGMQMVRQLEFAIFDFRLHLEYDSTLGGRIYQILNQVRDQVAVLKPPAYNRFPHGFSHIFAGGYAAGYYSYKWAEVLSADAYGMFEERGGMDADTGRRFLQCILERGGSRPAAELFADFRGRAATPDALLRHSGLAAA